MKITDNIEAHVVNDFIRLYGNGWELTIHDNKLDEKMGFFFWPGGPEVWIIIEDDGKIAVSFRDRDTGKAISTLTI